MKKGIMKREYESPKAAQIMLNLEGLLCASLEGIMDGNDDMPSEDLGDIFG